MTKNVRAHRRRFGRIGWVVTAGVVLILVGAVLVTLGAERLAAISKARAWTVAGAPCASLSREDYLASAYRIDQVFDYDKVRFGRGYGYVNCVDIYDHGGVGLNTIPVCQFNSPSVLQVTTGRGDFYYLTGVHPVTISIIDQRPHCVLNASAGLIS